MIYPKIILLYVSSQPLVLMTIPAFDFSHYLTYQELTDYLTQMAQAYPNLMQLESLGKTDEGREIWLATLTDKTTGEALEKPGYWIDANTHAAEVTGSAVACYILYQALSQYNQDSRISHLLENYTLYILPRIAVDGAEKYLQTPYNLRSSPRPYPQSEQQEGLYPEDVNGDGLILNMRIKDPCGAWKVSEDDSRLMIRRQPDEFGGSYYTLVQEGLIHNYNGYEFKIAPTLEGLDFNRNYPYYWQPEGEQNGAGDFPFSEPETRAEAEFWRKHRNINGFMTYHTFGALILRPYSTHPDDHFPTADLEIYELMGRKGTALTGYKCIGIYKDFRYDPKTVVYGAMDDYGYDHWGWFGFTVELWDAAKAAGVEKENNIEWGREHPVEDDLKILQWNDEYLQGKGFIDWQGFEHPQLGAVEIGGWDMKRMWKNAPAKALPEICDRHFQFAITHALMSPRLSVARTQVSHQGADIYRLTVQWENLGFLPTYTSKKALERQAVRPTRVKLGLPDGVTLISGEKQQEIEHLEGRSNKWFNASAQGMDYRTHRSWVVKGKRGTEVSIEAIAERAGTVRTQVILE